MSLCQGHVIVSAQPAHCFHGEPAHCFHGGPMSSPFTSKLGTNYCPQDAEIAEIKALIVEPGLRLKCLDDEITDLQQALAKLKEEHSRLGTYIEGHMALISPARRLPLDIIQEIFLACIPTHRNCVMSATEAPVLLGRICSSWRTISLSTPRLWSTLHIALSPYNNNMSLVLYEEKLLQRLATTKTWLARSGECGLSISLQGPYYAVGLSEATQVLLQALLPLSSRWEHIEFTAVHSVLAALSHLTEADVPTLKSFTVNEIHDGQGHAIQPDSFPLLRGLAISSISLSEIAFSPLELPLRWDNLVNLSIMAGWGQLGDPLITSEVALHLLSRCPALQTCQLQVNDLPDTGSGMKHIIECASLHALDLQIGGDLATTMRELLPRLSFPALRHLKLCGPSSDGDGISYTPCFFATAPCLERLTINLLPFSKSSLIDFLRGLSPTIRTLRIEETYGFNRSSILDDDVLAALIPAPSSPAPWFSNLQELGIHGCGAFSDQALLHFIQSGMTAPALGALKRLAIQFNREMQLDILPDLQHVINGGLHIELAYSAPPVYNFHFSPWWGLPDDLSLPMGMDGWPGYHAAAFAARVFNLDHGVHQPRNPPLERLLCLLSAGTSYNHQNQDVPPFEMPVPSLDSERQPDLDFDTNQFDVSAVNVHSWVQQMQGHQMKTQSELTWLRAENIRLGEPHACGKTSAKQWETRALNPTKPQARPRCATRRPAQENPRRPLVRHALESDLKIAHHRRRGVEMVRFERLEVYVVGDAPAAGIVVAVFLRSGIIFGRNPTSVADRIQT
ncbi:hypothetical protein DFH09DRAFT_1293237 [Mycena vulgaris]|nr:hypothetical protein DFH09DRAFT_1293237 [Mycena vulgaris]